MQKGRRPARRQTPRPREGVWSGRPLPVRRTARPLPGWWKPLVYGPLMYVLLEPLIGLGTPAWMGGVFIVGLVAWTILVLVWRIAETLALRELNRDRAFSDAPPGVQEFPMEIVPYDAGAYLGADRGFAWFDEGRLIFNGAACSFALAAGDFYARDAAGSRRNFYAGVPKDALRLGTYGRTAYVRLRPLMGLRGWGFRFTLQRFLRQSVGTGAPRQWPPLAPYDPKGPQALAWKSIPGFSLDPGSARSDVLQ